MLAAPLRSVLWIGPSPPPRGLADLLAARALELSAPAGPAHPFATAGERAPAVVCFGPGVDPRAIREALGSAARAAPAAERACVVLADRAHDLSSFQTLIDDDLLFYLSRGPLPAEDLAELIASAAASLEPESSPGGRALAPHPTLDRLLSADLLRRLVLAETPAQLADAFAPAIARVVAADRGRCLLCDPDLRVLWSPAAGSASEAGESAAVGLSSFVFRTGRALCLEAVGADPRYDRELDNPGGSSGDRLLAVPVLAGQGDVVAVLVALRGSAAPAFEPAEIAALEAVAAHAAPYLAPWVLGGSDAGPSDSPFRRSALRELESPGSTGPEPLGLERRTRPRFSWPGPGSLAAAARAVRRAFAGLGLGRRRLRFIPQAAAADCGAACLAMALGAHGKVVSLDEVRKVTGLFRHGLDAHLLREAAAHFGLRGRGVHVRSPEALTLLDPGSILHWEFRHFVVLERAYDDGAWILDPGTGRRFVSRSELDRALTGVALVLEPGVDFEAGGKRDSSLLRRYLARVLRHNTALVRIVLSSILLQLFALAVPVLTGVLIDRVIPEGEPRLFWILAGGAVALVGFSFVTALVRGHILLALRTRLDAQLTQDFLEHLVYLPFSFFQQRSAGDLLMRLGSNATIREILTSTVLSGALDGLMVASYLALILLADLRLGLLVAGLAIIRIAILVGALGRRRRLTSEALQAQAASQSYEVQMLAGIEALKACGAERRAIDSWSRLFVRELNVSVARGRLDALVNSLLDGLALASPVAILLYGASRVMAGDLTLGTMFALAALASGFLAPLSTLVSNAAQFQLLGSYLERLQDVLSTAREPQNRDRPRPAAFAGGVALDEVTFHYGPLVPPALEEVSFAVEPGQLVAVVGSSGSGKSTLAGLVAGLLEPESGVVLYDGRPLDAVPREWLRSHLAYVPQQSYLFGTSIRANIALQDPALPLDLIVEAARLAEIDEEISLLPLGYETVLADGGASLSGGQRQRIALARALVAGPRVLVLDEATSALDAVTEQKIQRNLSRLETTRIVAAHRLSTIRAADRILVLERGRIADAGTHDELIARPGLYRELVAAQLAAGPAGSTAAGPRAAAAGEALR